METLLEPIPEKQLTPEQKRLRPLREIPLYRWRQEPTDVTELFHHSIRIAIWCDNEAVIYIKAYDLKRSSLRCLSFVLRDDNDDDDIEEESLHLYGDIVGHTDEAIAETATLFLSLQHPATVLRLDETHQFNVASFRPEQLTQNLDRNPNLDLQTGRWSTEQAVVLATRSYPIQLVLGGHMAFSSDGGTAFVEALETRTSNFGSLGILADDNPLSQPNLKRLLQLSGKLERLGVSLLKDKDMLLLPLSAKVNGLKYELEVKRIQENAFDTLDIAAKEISLTFYLDYVKNGYWYGYVVSFFDRLAQLGHVEKLTLSLDYLDSMSSFADTEEDISSIADALIRVIQGNPFLTHLDVQEIIWCVDDVPHLPRIFEAMEDHPRLRTVIIDGCKNEADDDGVGYSSHLDYDALRQLLSRNHNIQVLDCGGDRISDGARIDKLYELNHYYHESLKLVTENTALRSQFVTAAWVESACGKLPHTAVLLAHHLDVLCELVADIDLDNLVVVPCENRGKRKTSQASRAAKRVAESKG
jgi:hypothetical protein